MFWTGVTGAILLVSGMALIAAAFVFGAHRLNDDYDADTEAFFKDLHRH